MAHIGGSPLCPRKSGAVVALGLTGAKHVVPPVVSSG